jgi:ATP-binding cassette subfamily G (WHITE) protein 2 (SNQ2)
MHTFAGSAEANDDACLSLKHSQPVHGQSIGVMISGDIQVLISVCRLLCLDNPTSGLDSSTALEFLQMMREFTSQSRCASVMSIYQGSDAIVPLFDKVLVVNSGRQIFYGPVAEAKAYFEGLGFKCSPTTTTTDFLNSMSADPEVRALQGTQDSQVPRTSADFESAFRSNQHYSSVLETIRLSNAMPVEDSHGKAVYPLTLIQQIWLCALRQFRILITDYRTWGVEMICIVVQSLVLGTLFRNQRHSTQSLFILASSLFYSVLVPALQSMAEFQNTFAQRPLVLKHKRYQFYRPLAYAFGLVVTDLAWKIVAVAYNIPLYWLTNFQRTPSHFFIWFLTVYVEHVCLSMFFRAIAIFSSNMNKAILPVGIMFNCFVLYTGLYVPAPQMQVWLGWFRYCNVSLRPLPSSTRSRC